MKQAALILLMLGALAKCSGVHAAPPAGADPNSALGQWFKSLTVPGNPEAGCCSLADCRTTDYRIRGDHYEVWIGRDTYGVTAPDAWVAVPAEAVLTRENPTGEGVACWYQKAVRCFVPSGAT